MEQVYDENKLRRALLLRIDHLKKKLLQQQQTQEEEQKKQGDDDNSASRQDQPRTIDELLTEVERLELQCRQRNRKIQQRDPLIDQFLQQRALHLSQNQNLQQQFQPNKVPQSGLGSQTQKNINIPKNIQLPQKQQMQEEIQSEEQKKAEYLQNQQICRVLIECKDRPSLILHKCIKEYTQSDAIYQDINGKRVLKTDFRKYLTKVLNVIKTNKGIGFSEQKIQAILSMMEVFVQLDGGSVVNLEFISDYMHGKMYYKDVDELSEYIQNNLSKLSDEVQKDTYKKLHEYQSKDYGVTNSLNTESGCTLDFNTLKELCYKDGKLNQDYVDGILNSLEDEKKQEKMEELGKTTFGQLVSRFNPTTYKNGLMRAKFEYEVYQRIKHILPNVTIGDNNDIVYECKTKQEELFAKIVFKLANDEYFDAEKHSFLQGLFVQSYEDLQKFSRHCIHNGTIVQNFYNSCGAISDNKWMRLAQVAILASSIYCLYALSAGVSSGVLLTAWTGALLPIFGPATLYIATTAIVVSFALALFAFMRTLLPFVKLVVNYRKSGKDKDSLNKYGQEIQEQTEGQGLQNNNLNTQSSINMTPFLSKEATLSNDIQMETLNKSVVKPTVQSLQQQIDISINEIHDKNTKGTFNVRKNAIDKIENQQEKIDASQSLLFDIKGTTKRLNSQNISEQSNINQQQNLQYQQQNIQVNIIQDINQSDENIQKQYKKQNIQQNLVPTSGKNGSNNYDEHKGKNPHQQPSFDQQTNEQNQTRELDEELFLANEDLLNIQNQSSDQNIDNGDIASILHEMNQSNENIQTNQNNSNTIIQKQQSKVSQKSLGSSQNSSDTQQLINRQYAKNTIYNKQYNTNSKNDKMAQNKTSNKSRIINQDVNSNSISINQ